MDITFMFALSQRMYLFEANLDFLTDTLLILNSTSVKVEPHYQVAFAVGPLVLPREKYSHNTI